MSRDSEPLAKGRLESLSSTVSDLFQKAVQNEEILRRYQQFELKILDLSGFEDLLDILINNSAEYFQLDGVELWLYDPQGTLAELLPEEFIELDGLRLLSRLDDLQALYGLQGKHGQQPMVRMQSLGEALPVPLFAGNQSSNGLRSAALLPLIRHGVLVGSLHFGASGHQRFSADKSTDFIEHLGSIVAVCLENAVNQERLHRLSMYDMLTQVKNRRAFHMALDKEISRAERNGDPLSLLFVDLDYFKQVNDTFGHVVGDKVLKEVAQTIDEMLRKTDHVCRYGGEEFALVLPNCGQQRAMEIAERIREKVSELVVIDDQSQQGEIGEVSVTLSIGVCCWLPMDELDEAGEQKIAQQLLACADRGVYQSKDAGRNCVHYVGLNDLVE